MQLKKVIRGFILFIILLQGIFWGNGVKSDAAEKIKIGYFDIGDYYHKASGYIDSYDTEYLNRIAQYSDFKYEYVDCGTWSNAMKMLKQHKIDLLGTMQKNNKREKLYDMCDSSYGTTVAEMVALPDNNYVYEDYDAIDQATVGVTRDYVRMSDLRRSLKQHNVSPKIKYYSCQETLFKALKSGEVDMIAANSHTVSNKWTVVERFCYSSMFFATWKGNKSLIAKIDESISQINIYDTEFDDERMKAKFADIMQTPFTQEELKCINRKKIYTIYFDGTTAPLVWYDKDTGKMKGIIIDICNKISENTGVKFRYLPKSEYDGKSSDYVVTYESVFSNSSVQPDVTESLFDTKFMMYYKVGSKINVDSDKQYTVAVANNRGQLAEYVKKQRPNFNVKEYDNPRTCINQLQKGDVDMAVLNEYVVENILIEEDIQEIMSATAMERYFGVALHFSGRDAEMMTAIINKGISMLTDDEVDGIVLNYTMKVVPDATLTYFIKNNAFTAIVIAIIMIVLFAVAAACTTYAIVMRKQREKIELVNKSKSNFFARMSHDMRTPMNGILGIANLALQEDDIDVVRKDLEKITDSGHYMLSLINDTLDVQRAESNKMKLEPEVVYVADLVENIISMIRPTAEEKNVDFIVTNKNADLECMVLVDPVRLKQIMNNVLSNAVKFTPSGGEVEFIVECLGHDGAIAHDKLTVRDTGVGMSQEFIRDGIFNPFTQEKNQMSMKYSGSGLGLSIARILTELMGGSIEVHSEIGKGTTFEIYLDFERASKKAVHKAEEVKNRNSNYALNALNGKRILVCEDHPLNAEITRRLIEKIGCEVEQAENGERGCEMFEQSVSGYYNAILMDIRMPVMDGLEAAHKIRKCGHPDAESIPIIAMSANAFEEDVSKSIDAGMDAHLAKPIEPHKLYEILITFITRRL